MANLYVFGPQNDFVLRYVAIVGIRDHHGQEEDVFDFVLDQVVLMHAAQKELEVPSCLTLRVLQMNRVCRVKAL